VLILPWNLRREIAAQAGPSASGVAEFVVPIPALEVFTGPDPPPGAVP
jgi:hypothetical protein